MEKKMKNVAMACLASCALAFGLGAAVSGMRNTSQKSYAEGSASIAMHSGAQVRMDEAHPGLKFTADLLSYDETNVGLTYGMLILPEAAFEKIDGLKEDYIAKLDEYIAREENEGKEYINEKCTPYQTDSGDWRISLSIIDLKNDHYDMSFVGVGYIYNTETETYEYAEVDEKADSRSVAFVSQLALKYENSLTDARRQALETFAAVGGGKNAYADYEADTNEANGLTFSGDNVTSGVKDSYMAYKQVNASNGTQTTLMTKERYENITEIAYDMRVDSGFAPWFGMGFRTQTDSSAISVYSLPLTFTATGFGSNGATFTNNVGNTWQSLGVSGNTIADKWVRLKYVFTTNEENHQVCRLYAADRGADFDDTKYVEFYKDALNMRNSYLYWCYNEGAAEANKYLCVDNFSIKWNNGADTASEDFNGEIGYYGDGSVTNNLFEIRSGKDSKAISQQVANSNYGISVGVDGYYSFDFKDHPAGDGAYLRTIKTYSDISSVEVDIRILDSWAGISFFAPGQDHGYYATFGTIGVTGIGGNQAKFFDTEACENSKAITYASIKNTWVTLRFDVKSEAVAEILMKRSGEETFTSLGFAKFSDTAKYSFKNAWIGFKSQNTDFGVDNFKITCGTGENAVTETETFSSYNIVGTTNNQTYSIMQSIVSATNIYAGIKETVGIDVAESIADKTLGEKINAAKNGVQGAAIACGTLQRGTAVLEGSFVYEIDGEKSVAVSFGCENGNAYFLLLNQNGATFYSCKDGEIVAKSIEYYAGNTSGSVRFALTADGRLYFNFGSAYELIGTVEVPFAFAIKDVNGSGTARFTEISLTSYSKV